MMALYSVLVSDDVYLNDHETIRSALKSGIKIIAFCTEAQEAALKKEFEDYRKAKLLALHVVESDRPQIMVIDGQFAGKEVELNALAKKASTFNFEQYLIEHADVNSDLIVEAGAGTGKTTVMIDRILFLIHTVPNLSLTDIGMITFTNEATHNMKHKIQSALLERYQATGSSRYIYWLETASQMSIQTIHSFSNALISEIGMSIGFGSKVKLRGFKYERKQLIRDYLNDRFGDSHQPVESKFGISLHVLEDLIYDFWIRLDNIGLSDEQILAFDWGEANDESSIPLHTVLKDAFFELNKRYESLKLRNDAISVEDIVRELRFIIEKSQNLKLRRDPLKYLFVDEFQDSDNSQISTIAWLSKAYDLHLFVVGDVKQSIYRFRGAVETAFESLRAELSTISRKAPLEYKLIKNYRTAKEVMIQTDLVFKTLERKGLLLYGDSLVPQVPSNGEYDCIGVINSMELSKKTIEVLKSSLKDCIEYAKAHPNDEIQKQHVTVLTRTNFQLDQIGDLCRKNEIPCYIRKEGTFYRSHAVKAFFAMVRAFVFPSMINALVDYTLSPFVANTIISEKFLSFKNDHDVQLQCLRTSLESFGFDGYLKEFRLKPALTVLRSIIDNTNHIDRFASMRRAAIRNSNPGWKEEELDAQVRVEVAQYVADFELLSEILRDHFSGEMASLDQIYEFLRLNMLTNRNVDEPDISGLVGPECIYGMTVHKAKGLEFDTIIIPYTNRTFRRDDDTEILLDESTSPVKVGWSRVVWADMYKKEIKEQQCNDYYRACSRKESSDTEREEARLLYVAMTRAMRKLVCIICGQDKPHTWANLMKG